MKWKCFISLIIWIPALGLCDPDQCLKENDVQVKTTTGKIKGTIEVVGDGNVMSFFGIPYAEPPIGENRYKKPIPIKPWEGVLDADKKPPACVHVAVRDFDWVGKGKQDENCLYLNIWVPENLCTSSSLNATNHLLPVMTWIHGGGFWSGSSNIELYDGTVLAANAKVVVASMNYRIGSLGFLYAGTSDVPGNLGLHDQQLALEWIKTNIKSFCGDPDQITLFGESAGSMAVGLHLLSPKSKNLFRRAILESGSPYHLLFTALKDIMKQRSIEFANALGCGNETVNLVTDSKQVLTCLRNVDAKTLTEAESKILNEDIISFTPIYGDDFLPKSPIELVNTKSYKQTEILLGTNKDEGAIFLNFLMPNVFKHHSAPDLTIDQAKSILDNIIKKVLKFPTTKEVIDFYLGSLKEGNPKDILKAVHNVIGDFIFVCPTIYLAEKLAAMENVYYYLYTHKSSKTVWGDWVDVGHFEEVPFVFGVPLKTKTYTDEENKFSFDIMQMWAAFARGGRPLPKEQWPSYANGGKYKEINPKRDNIGERLRGEACDFWRIYYGLVK